jgi:ferredoxin
MCTGIAPDLFELDQDGQLVVLIETPTVQQLGKLDAAIACCPVEAISRTD